MPRVSPDHLEARRQQILDGARAAFARHGYEGATVRVLEEEIGLSRGAIFHHFADKDAVFMALAGQDAARMAEMVAREGLVAVMRDMIAAPDAGLLGTQLEVSRRSRTDPAFRDAWADPVGSGAGGHPGPAASAARGRGAADRRRRGDSGVLPGIGDGGSGHPSRRGTARDTDVRGAGRRRTIRPSLKPFGRRDHRAGGQGRPGSCWAASSRNRFNCSFCSCTS